MSAWTQPIDAVLLGVFGIPVTFTPRNDSGPQQITGIVQNPAMAEDYAPGSIQGASVVRLFVRLDAITPAPQHGDLIAISGATYNIVGVDADIYGGAVLKLRAI